MKYQCAHNDTGLCETCFKYEQQLSQLQEDNTKLKRQIALIREEWVLVNEFVQGGKMAAMRSEIAEIKLEAERLREALADFGRHDSDCILAQWHQGRPTEDGGYEAEYGHGSRRKWYRNLPVDETPKCECGLDNVLSHPTPPLYSAVVALVEAADYLLKPSKHESPSEVCSECGTYGVGELREKLSTLKKLMGREG